MLHTGHFQSHISPPVPPVFPYRRPSHMQKTTYLFLTAILICSILSSLNICTGACSSASQYTFLGVQFAWVGLTFSVLAIALCVLEGRGGGRYPLDILVIGAAGAEIKFLLVQHNEIGHWCPICVIIAALVMLLAVIRGAALMRGAISREFAWRVIAGMGIFSCMWLGLAVACLAVKPPPSDAATPPYSLNNGGPNSASVDAMALLGQLDIWMGNTSSDVEIFFISDWYCPFCRRTEPEIEKAIPVINKTARYTFLDLPVHAQSRGVVPYHTDLLLGDKAQYMEARKALLKVTGGKTAPTQAEIMKSLTDHGIKWPSVDAMAAKKLPAMSSLFFLQQGIRTTPTAIIINRKTRTRAVLEGQTEITPVRLAEAIQRIAH
jgi:hypothetical protein